MSKIIFSNQEHLVIVANDTTTSTTTTTIISFKSKFLFTTTIALPKVIDTIATTTDTLTVNGLQHKIVLKIQSNGHRKLLVS